MKSIRPILGSIIRMDRFAKWNLFTAAKNRLASGLNTNIGVLAVLARRVNITVQQRVAENSSTDCDTLNLLSQHECSNVRSAVAQNASTNITTMDFLSIDADCDVRYAMAENPWTSTRLLSVLAEDENPYVQNRARKTQDRLKAQEVVLTVHEVA